MTSKQVLIIGPRGTFLSIYLLPQLSLLFSTRWGVHGFIMRTGYLWCIVDL